MEAIRSMNKPKVFEKPHGVKDYLPDAASRLRQIETRVLTCLQQWGYREIITPTLEYYDTVGMASSTSDDKLFKLLDKHGNTLVLRSDLTAPIARVVSSLLKDRPLPLRLAYHANVFRAFEEEAGKGSEFYQTGGELVGDGSAEADAEVIALAVAALRAAGIDDFRFAVGHVGFLNALFRETLQDQPDVQDALKECLLKRDHVGFRRIIRTSALSAEAKEELEGILRLRGGKEICAQAHRMTDDPAAQEALDHLCRVWDALEDYGARDNVLIDLTMIGDFSYYTGMTFEGYAAELGFPVCSGGRYDNLLKQFGRPAPATGFALKTNRILEVLGKQPVAEPHRVLILYDEASRRDAIRAAVKLRREPGKMVVTRKIDAHKPEIRRPVEHSEQSGGGRQGAAYLVDGEPYDELLTFASERKD
jgi:ATP phosphoribosyltransferase regulatory subunit